MTAFEPVNQSQIAIGSCGIPMNLKQIGITLGTNVLFPMWYQFGLPKVNKFYIEKGYLCWTHIERYLKIGVAKIIVHVMKHANFSFIAAFHTRETGN